jgi:hypothetical protein
MERMDGRMEPPGFSLAETARLSRKYAGLRDSTSVARPAGAGGGRHPPFPSEVPMRFPQSGCRSRLALAASGAALLLLVAALPARAQRVETTPPPAVPDSLNQPGPWKPDLTLGLGLAQSAFSSNWAGGDLGTITWIARIEGVAERQVSTRFNWRQWLGVAYGQTTRQVREGTGDLRWEASTKSTDNIGFESTARWTLHGFADPYASLRLDTQFRDESSPYGVIHFNPVKLKESAGIARVLRKTANSEVISRLGVGVRQTLGRSFVSFAPLATGSFTSNDGGFEWNTIAHLPLASGRISYRGELMVFAPLFYSGKSALERYDAEATALDPAHRAVADDWRVPDVDFRNSFSTQVTRVISVDLFVQMVYDRFDTAANVDPQVSDPLTRFSVVDEEVRRNLRRAAQWKQTLSIGLTYKMF